MKTRYNLLNGADWNKYSHTQEKLDTGCIQVNYVQSAVTLTIIEVKSVICTAQSWSSHVRHLCKTILNCDF